MKTEDFYKVYSSDCVAGSSNQITYDFPEREEFTGRVAYKLAHGGTNYSLLFSNQIDSTYASGQYSKCNETCEPWTISRLRAGLSNAWNEYPNEYVDVTFDGKKEKTVENGELFCTDPIHLNAVQDEYLHIEMTFTARVIPCHREIVLSVEKKNENGEYVEDNTMPVPLMIGSDRKVSKRVAFLGDSITQGCGTPRESYAHWVAKIQESLSQSISVWDLGIGCGHAYDAASNGCWLARAKHCDIVNICFGVNDILQERTYDEIVNDLEQIVSLLKASGCKTVIFTIPPFDFVDESRKEWTKLNEYIRTTLSKKCDGFFDFAKYSGQDAPNGHLARYGGHPNVEGCAVIARGYLNDIDLERM